MEKAVVSADLDELTTKPDTSDAIPEPKSVTYVDYENPFSFARSSDGAPHVSKLSTYAWVGCGGDVYVLECLGKGYIRIEPVEDENGETWPYDLLDCTLMY